jgi:hypothetical protein
MPFSIEQYKLKLQVRAAQNGRRSTRATASSVARANAAFVFDGLQKTYLDFCVAKTLDPDNKLLVSLKCVFAGRQRTLCACTEDSALGGLVEHGRLCSHSTRSPPRRYDLVFLSERIGEVTSRPRVSAIALASHGVSPQDEFAAPDCVDTQLRRCGQRFDGLGRLRF